MRTGAKGLVQVIFGEDRKIRGLARVRLRRNVDGNRRCMVLMINSVLS